MSSRPEPRLVLPGLYAILDVDSARAHGHAPGDVLRAWLDAGVTLLQLRAKTLPLGPFVELAGEAVSLAAHRGAIVVVNDRADVARLSRARGVHVGQDDLAAAEARDLLGADAIVGLSTHTPAHLARALGEPIDYVAIGPVFPTGTKASEWRDVGLDGVRAAAKAVGGRLPLVAIGGITLERAAAVLAAGASSVAVISDLLAGGPAERVSAYLQALGGFDRS